MKPPRTVGLSFAILAGVMWFALLPLLEIATSVLIQYRVNSIEIPVTPQGDTAAPIASGGELLGITTLGVGAQLATSLGFLVIAALAWRGRPRWIRGAMIAAVLLLLIWTTINAYTAMSAIPDIRAGFDSGMEVGRSLAFGRLVIGALIALYMLWYMNRGPARAFYRGYYLRRDEQAREGTP
ncbi:MAG: hypothetical protein IAE80_20845 [Anaerolinea sp.]|nr:hypothetical protein [Anaerolinea sp.]